MRSFRRDPLNLGLASLTRSAGAVLVLLIASLAADTAAQGPYFRKVQGEAVPGLVLEGDRIGDVNQDGYDDFSLWSGDPARVISGLDRQVWAVFGTAEVGGGTRRAIGADVSGDGNPEIIYGSDVAKDLTVAPSGIGGGWVQAFDGLTLESLWWTTGPGPTFFGHVLRRLGDVTGDGVDEILVQAGNCPALGCLYVVGANGAILSTIVGGSGSHAVGSPLYGPYRVGDVDGDGVVDFGYRFSNLGGGPGVAEIFSGASLGATVIRVHPGDLQSGFGVGDTNGDGRDEYVLGNPELAVPSGAGAAWLFDGMTGAVLRTYTVGGSFHLGGGGGPLEDLDGDGVADFVLGSAALFYPPGTGPPGSYVFSTMTGAVLQGIPDGASGVYPVGDLDRDGRLDLVAYRRWISTALPNFYTVWLRRTLIGPQNPVLPGGVISFQVDVPAQPGKPFRILLSGSVSTGFSLGTRRVPVDLDPILLGTLGDSGLLGLLDGAGQATRTLAVPADPALSGLTVHGVVLTFDPTAPLYVRTIGAPESVTIQ